MALALAPHSFAGIWLKNVAAAQKVAKEKNQLILVDMFAEWCGWCHRFEREVFPSAVFQQATSDMVLLRLDTEDKGEGTQFARKYSISSLPTFLVLAPDLTIAGIIRGYAPPNDFVRNLTDTRAKYTSFQQRVKNEAKLGKDWVQRISLAKEFTMRGAYDKSIPRLKQLTIEKGVPAAFRDESYYNLAMAYAAQAKYDEAQKVIQQLATVSKAGEWREQSQILSGKIYYEQGNFLASRNQLRNFIETYPNSAQIETVEMLLADVERRLSSGKR